MTLHSLLTDSRTFSSRYGDGMANHLAMALVALDRLGASESRLSEYAAFYQRRLQLKDPHAPPLPERDWRGALGRPAFEATLVEHFAGELREKGKEALLSEVVSALTPGIASGAFHGVIRTAYAVDSGDDADLADALASWVIAYEDPGAGGSPHFHRAVDAFEALHLDQRFAQEYIARSIAARIRKVVAVPAFEDYRSSIVTPHLGDLSRVATAIYAASDNFTALHLVTGCHAARILAPFLAPSAMDSLGTAMLAAYASFGRPAFDLAVPIPDDLPDWETLADQTIMSDDEHDLKFVYSCREEERHYGWGLHRLAASRRVSRRMTSDE